MCFWMNFFFLLIFFLSIFLPSYLQATKYVSGTEFRECVRFDLNPWMPPLLMLLAAVFNVAIAETIEALYYSLVFGTEQNGEFFRVVE